MLSLFDIIGSLLCIGLLWIILSIRLKKYDLAHRRLFVKAFRFKILCSVVYTLITAYYYRGGDTEMFFYAVRDMHQAINANDLDLKELLFMEKVADNHPLAYHFQMDNTKYPVIGFMHHAGNFMVPKLGLLPYTVFFKSYLPLCLCFSFFALAGAIRLYKLFLHYFPKIQVQVALSTLFLPSACYWSSGFLKDSICFGAVGFLLYGLFSLLILRKHKLISLIWVILSVYLIYTTKVYILLALIPGIGFWLFGELSTGVKTPTLKRLLTFASLIVAGVAAFAFVNYLTSDAALSKFSMDNILESSDYSRRIFERQGGRGSSFQFSTTNPVLLILNGLVATFFRPFPWEVNSFIVLFSAAESLLFLALMIYLFSKKGIVAPFRKIFGTPILIMSFTFAIIFAISVGISTTNFGSLSRYKIPCLPFYLMFVLGAYHLTGLATPVWMQRILSLIVKPNPNPDVRHRRIPQSQA